MNKLAKNPRIGIATNDKVLLKSILNITTTLPRPIVSDMGGWQCCKCRESMYRSEITCTWPKCNHQKCKNCRNFQV